MPEGTPPIIKVLDDDSYHTTLEVTIPGMWVEEVSEGGYTFQKLELPDYATLGDIGKPAIPAMGMFVGFLEPSTNSIEYKDEDKEVLENILVYPEQKPMVDDQEYSFSFDQKFYAQDIWFPKERATVSKTSIMREVCVTHTGIVPFEYNPAKQELIVHPQMLVTVYHKPGAEGYGDWSMPIGADPDFVEMYRSVIVNYDNLGMAEVDATTGYDYLLITRDEFLDQAQTLQSILNDVGHNVEIHSYSYKPTSGDLKNYINNYYLQNHNDYVLLFGNIDHFDTNYVVDPQNQSQVIFSDIWYVVFPPYNPQCPVPSLAIGRLSVQDDEEANTEVQKIYQHYSAWYPQLQLKCLLVASKPTYKGMLPFVPTKEDIRMYVYPLYDPTFTTEYGTIQGVDNGDVVQAIGGGYQVVNYHGHSTEYEWENWDLIDENFSHEEISQIVYLQSPPFRPVVFNVTCLTGDFVTTWPDECQAESWMNLSRGAKGVIAATMPTNGEPNHTFDRWLFKTLYGYSENGNIYGGEGHLGMIMNWANIKTMLYYSWGSLWSAAVHNFYSYLVFGDPSLFILPTDSSFAGINDKREILKNTLVSANPQTPSVTVYPNPVVDRLNISIVNCASGEMKLKLYDISGRVILEKTYPIETGSGEITLDLSGLGLKSGIYISKIDAPGITKTFKVVFTPER
jgi:hypothetical protein